MAKSSRAGWALFAAALLLSVVIVLFGWRKQPFVNNAADPYYFSAMGSSLAHGQGWAEYGNMLHRRTPLYPLVIGGIYSVSENPLLVKLLQCVLFALTCLLAMEVGRRLFNARTGLIAGAACLLHPMLLRYVPDFHLETLLTFLFTLTLFATVLFYERPSVRNGVFLGIASGLASLTKAVAIAYPILFAAMLLWLGWRQRRRGLDARAASVPWTPLAACFVALLLVLAPWTVRNYRVTGHAVLLGTGMSDAFLRGYIFSQPDYALLRKPPYTYAEIASDEWFEKLCRDAGTVWQRDDIETDRVLNQASKRLLLSDPAGFVRKFVVGLFTFWYEMTNLPNSLVAGGAALVAWVFALVGWGRCRREKRPAWLLWLPVLYLNLSLAALLALGRYCAPVTPPLVILAAFGLDGLLGRKPAEERAAAPERVEQPA